MLNVNDGSSMRLDIHKVLCDLRSYLLETELVIHLTYLWYRASYIN